MKLLVNGDMYILDYLRRNKDLLNISCIAKQVGMNPSHLHHAIRGDVDGHGTPVKIPEKYFDRLGTVLSRLTF